MNPSIESLAGRSGARAECWRLTLGPRAILINLSIRNRCLGRSTGTEPCLRPGKTNRDRVAFEGDGKGHGIGPSARALAERTPKFSKVLRRSHPNAIIVSFEPADPLGS